MGKNGTYLFCLILIMEGPSFRSNPGLNVEDLIRAIMDPISPGSILGSSLSEGPHGPMVTTIEEQADPELFLDPHMKVFLIGIGKASEDLVPTAYSLLSRQGIDILKRPVIIIPGPGRKGTLKDYRLLKGEHPIPGPKDQENMDQLLEIISGLDDKVQVLVLLSGGASSLSFHPRKGIDPDLKVSIIRELMGNGSDIGSLNTVRTFLSYTKGGGLLCFGPYLKWRTLILSDVVGDDPRFIGSGLTYPWEPDPAVVGSIIEKGIGNSWITREMIQNLGKNNRTRCDPSKVDSRTFTIANHRTAAMSAVNVLKLKGFSPFQRDLLHTGDARHTASILIKEAREVVKAGNYDSFISAGETTVKVKGVGKGGRNSEMVASMFGNLEREEIVICFGTDGKDGIWEGAGGWVTGQDTRTIETENSLKENDTGSYLIKNNRAVITDPTGNNLGDLFIYLHLSEQGHPRLRK